jgi:ketosteroid isomerase-like protein
MTEDRGAEEGALALVDGYFDALNSRNWDALDALVRRNVVFAVVPYGLQVPGAMQVVTGSRMQGTELPDFHTEVLDAFEQGGIAFARTLTTYTLTAPWDPRIPGLEPVIAAGARVAREGCFVFVARSGKIARITHYHDRLSVVRQVVAQAANDI